MSSAATESAAAVEAGQLFEPVAQDATWLVASSNEQFYGTLPLLHPSRNIRVLDLYPAEPSWPNSPLTGHLRVVDLDTAPSFAALSYVWGAMAEPCDTILCQPQEHHLKITANCHSALWSLRKRFGTVTIWVDSLCINLGDREEKAVQIPLMSRIYADAERTYLWLGPGNEVSDQAMDYLNQWGKLRARLPFHLVALPDWSSAVADQMFAHMWRARLRTLSEALGS